MLRVVFKYRIAVVSKNLNLAFPNLKDSDRNKILKNSYRNLSDILIEGIKGASMNKNQLIERYKFTNPEIVQDLFKNGKSVILVTGHYNNWEWGALATCYFFEHRIIGLYKKLNNEYLEKYFKKRRAKTGLELVELSETSRGFKAFANNERPGLFLMAADQSPSNLSKAFWVHFLGLNTACLHGPGKYSKEYDLPIVYCDIQRVKRGFYTLELSWLLDDNKNYNEGEIVAKFMEKLEQKIVENPDNYLWSHNRWKRKYEGQEIIRLAD